jgi:hypothetical protein
MHIRRSSISRQAKEEDTSLKLIRRQVSDKKLDKNKF